VERNKQKKNPVNLHLFGDVIDAKQLTTPPKRREKTTKRITLLPRMKVGNAKNTSPKSTWDALELSSLCSLVGRKENGEKVYARQIGTGVG
jgi:hypothetical protein